MALRNIRQSNFNPANLQPAGPPERQYIGGGGDTGGTHALEQYATVQPMRDPQGNIIMMRYFSDNQSNAKSNVDYLSKAPDGRTVQYRAQPDGSYVEGDFEKRGFIDTVFGDEKLMTFLAVAGAGAAAGAAWGSGGAGGSMLGGGTGATPGVVAGGTMGQAGLGAATGTGLLGTMGGGNPQTGYDTQGLDDLISQQEAAHAGGAEPGFWNKLGSWLTGGGGAGGGIDGLFDLLGGAGNMAKDAGSLALMYKMYEDNKDNAEEWRNFMKSSTPDLGFYQGKLKQAYEDPGSFLGGPEYQAAQNIVHNKLQRSDAAGGRLANDFGRQVTLQDHAMGALGEYREGLTGLVNQQQNTYSGQAGGALENAQAAEGDWMKNLMNWLNSQGS